MAEGNEPAVLRALLLRPRGTLLDAVAACVADRVDVPDHAGTGGCHPVWLAYCRARQIPVPPSLLPEQCDIEDAPEQEAAE